MIMEVIYLSKVQNQGMRNPISDLHVNSFFYIYHELKLGWSLTLLAQQWDLKVWIEDITNPLISISHFIGDRVESNIFEIEV